AGRVDAARRGDGGEERRDGLDDEAHGPASGHLEAVAPGRHWPRLEAQVGRAVEGPSRARAADEGRGPDRVDVVRLQPRPWAVGPDAHELETLARGPGQRKRGAE